jgi:hypothetical protein
LSRSYKGVDIDPRPFAELSDGDLFAGEVLRVVVVLGLVAGAGIFQGSAHVFKLEGATPPTSLLACCCAMPA